MKSELLLYAQVGMYAGHPKGLPSFPLASRCDPGSEATHEDCWAAIIDPEEFFGVIELSNVPEPGLWIAKTEYREEDIDESDETAWSHLCHSELEPCGPTRFQEISEQIHARSMQEKKEFPANKWRWL